MPEVLKKIEDATGLKFDIIETKDRQEYADLLTSDQHIDVKIDTYTDYYQAEINGYKITDAYLSTNVDKITGKFNSDVVAILKYADPTEVRKDILSSDQQLLYCDSNEECIQAVKNGTAGSTYLYTYQAQYYVDSDTSGSLKAVTLPQYTINYSFGVAVDDDYRLLTIMDFFIRHLFSA